MIWSDVFEMSQFAENCALSRTLWHPTLPKPRNITFGHLKVFFSGKQMQKGDFMGRSRSRLILRKNHASSHPSERLESETHLLVIVGNAMTSIKHLTITPKQIWKLKRLCPPIILAFIISHIIILRYTLYIKRFIKADTIIFFWVVFQIFLLAQELLPEEKTILCSGFW